MAGQGEGARMRRAEAMAAATMIGRDQGPELFYSTDVTLGGTAGGSVIVNVPRTLTLNRPLKSMTIALRGRLVVGTAPFTSVSPEHLTNLLSQIQLAGIHRVYGNLVPLRISGATTYQWNNIWGSRAKSRMLVNGALVSPPGNPFTFNSTAAGSPLVFDGTAGTYDFEIFYEVPLGIQFPASAGAPQRGVSFLYLPQDWADSLQLQLTMGDRSSIGVPGGTTTTTFTAIGSGTGLPSLAVHLNYSILGAFGNKLKSGVVIRTEQAFTGFSSIVNQTRLSLLQKQITTNVLLKAGLAQNASTSPVFATLSDSLLGRSQIMVDNKPIRNNQDNGVAKAYGQSDFDTVWPTGYLGFSFINSQNPMTAYRGDGLQGGSTFEINTDILTANAANQISMVQEMVYGGPYPALKPGA